TVGFHGAPPVKLDAYTQSGGERSTTIMAFLLALQEHVASPIRAVDEFDVHMDPKNREAVARLIVETVRENPETQYIVITPWHHPIFDEEARVIVVQKVGGKSEVAVVEGEAQPG
ncbi:MAG: AAA family ATPase, partial [Candidatus Hecatellaceae archaeon]